MLYGHNSSMPFEMQAELNTTIKGSLSMASVSQHML